ncbi:protein-tyrosine phosphatase family protein [Primorskyibacter sp. S87]|uniref:protein-tyrosine phosphatase family protein n=1 Tax=Primorskyibacter sp. S87 TaxID=3415126 RepID=UPI003C7E038B
MTKFKIFELPVGGGTLAFSAMPGSSGDYAADLQKILKWRPALVISMTTETENTNAGIGQIARDLKDCMWVNFPVPDYGIPIGAADREWCGLGESARRHLHQGARVLVHCKGGCGRSGMIVLRLMIESGEALGPALSRLRVIRPCAVETEAQLTWAGQGRLRGGLA